MKKQLQFFMTMVATVLFGSMSMAQCLPGEGLLTVDVTTDTWGYEVYWEMTPTGSACGTGTVYSAGTAAVGCAGGGAQVAAAGPNSYPNGVTTTDTVGCYDLSLCYDVHLIDDWGDGATTFDFKVNGVSMYTFTTTGGNEIYTICMSVATFDLRVDSVGIGTYYSLVPLSQVAPLSFDAKVFNFGSSDVTNAMATVIVNDGTADVATATSAPVATLVSGMSSTVSATTGYTAVGLGTHTFTFVGSITELDERSFNDTMIMMVTYTDSVLARDNGTPTGSLGFGTGAADGAQLGTQFTLPVADDLTSVTAVFNGPTLGDSTKFSVYDMAGGIPNTVVATSATYVFTAADTAGLVLTLPLSMSLPAGDFVVVAHEYGSNVSLGTDATSMYEATTNWIISTAVTTGAWDNGENFGFPVNYVLRANFASGAGLGENALNSATVYPNPTKGNVTVSLSESVNDATVTVYSVSGAVVSSEVVSGTQFTVNLDGLNNGLYIMELSNGSEKGVYRIVKD